MVFTNSDVSKVAKLARLKLGEDEINRYAHDLERILSFIDELKEVDIKGIAPMSHAGQSALSFREDIAMDALGRECIKSSAGYEDGLVRVPKIIE